MKSSLDLRAVAKKYHKQLCKIKVFISDVDGILTNGQIFYSGEEVGFNRFFHAHDGYGFKILKEAGIKVGFISGGNSVGLVKRAEYLGLDYLMIGDEDKRHAYNEVKKLSGCSDDEILYMGDEFFDLPILECVGFSATVPNASLEIQDAVDYVTTRNGGEGAVREVIDILRYAQNIVPKIDR